jgi:hypothetical protein
MRVVDAGRFEQARQLRRVELRIESRPRDGADINQPLNTVRLQQLNEIFDRARRVPNRENTRSVHIDQQPGALRVMPVVDRLLQRRRHRRVAGFQRLPVVDHGSYARGIPVLPAARATP